MKIRADKLVVERGLAPTREKAQALILAGLVYRGEVRIDKAGQLIGEDTALSLRGKPCPYVSRGGLKLEAALDAFNPEILGAACADVGASTGGFTDCLLQRGAARVFSIDVGHGQLDMSLRSNPRVVCMEGVNARYLTGASLPEPVSLVTVDASFISLRLLLPAIKESAPGASVIALVKPQFEAGRGQVGKGGVVRDEEVRRGCVESVCETALSLGYTLGGTIESPLKGPKGNVEFLIYLRPAEP